MRDSEAEHLADLIVRTSAEQAVAAVRLEVLEQFPPDDITPTELTAQRRDAARHLRIIEARIAGLQARLEVLVPDA